MTLTTFRWARLVFFSWSVCLLAGVPAARAADEENVKEFVYKKGGDYSLKMHVHLPPDWKEGDKRPAIVFFFGGGWRSGKLTQFESQAKYLAGRGMVAARADYRVKSRHGVTPDRCVEDAKSAVRWLRQNATKLGLDPNRIAASGGSAGGHLAIATFTTPGLDADGEDLNISSKPNLLVLYNPALIGADAFIERETPRELAAKIAPNANLSKDVPPTLIFFGTSDRLIEGGREFMKKAKELGLDAELHTAAEQPHGFFNRAPWQESTTHQTDLFLTRHGYVQGSPTIKPPANGTLKRAE